ncbi:MAG: response regulator [Candidatus Neomarinimicrobiota bacterium]|nr:MAG: response regulator [Candidatus Neomarinimicrobiota bacterium]
MSEQQAQRPVVLVVEDDLTSQQLMNFFLRNEYEVRIAASVPTAKEMLADGKVKLILLDFSLEGDEDGLDLARWLRKLDDERKKTPIVALTAHAFTTDRDNAIEAGCDDFLTKPVRQANLMETIHKYV